MLDALTRANQIDNTLFIFTSDHGYFYGEHCLGPERRLAYEETIRIPLLMRLPSRIRPGLRPPAMALSLDIAPTALELAGVRPTAPLHGRSLMPLFRAATSFRDAALFEYFSDTVFPRIRNMGYRAVRTKDWKLIHYTELPGADELYNLQADPCELRNLIASEPRQRDRMRQILTRLLGETGA
jgi:N-acetylglucosamine-6-sulfatase